MTTEKHPTAKHPADKHETDKKHNVEKTEVQAADEGANAPQVKDNPVADPPLNAEIHPKPTPEAVAAREALDRAEQGGGAVTGATPAASPDDLAALVLTAANSEKNASIIVRNESDRSAVQKLISSGKHSKLTVKVDPGLGVRGLWRAGGAG